ncbi:beta-lactamase superfamily protein [Colletotrichum incanum]|uniref:Beta-lactamase superfamily protein n=1 Tax=Colletotrichum incanum TaxID=1573173 RepID=A0A161YE27_COLIC|nr:beta-lactamase superfamily protein [Colletotrichum incanum]OHW92453.1 lactamase domain-containing protein [Colletotrichum incanum]
MALTVKQLNADASFLLTFEPIVPESIPGITARSFRILMDPWITGPSTIFHSMLSTATHKECPCVCSLQHLPEPDLVIISQHKSDHCNEATLRQLPASGTRTLILAEPAAAKVIRSWKYFDKDKVHTIPRWEDPHATGKQSVIRVKVPPFLPGGEPGEVSIAFIPQRRDFKGLHAAVGITYRPPPTWPRFTHLLTPPETPVSQHSRLITPQVAVVSQQKPRKASAYLSLTTPPETPSSRSLCSVRSAASIAPAPDARDKAVSIIFSPHGISYRCLEKYASTHLKAEAALPLTALLHCFDTVSNPWWLGGNISAGMPAGQETAAALGAKAWVSTHDGDKDVKGLVTKMLKTKRYTQKQIAAPSSSGQRRGDRYSRRVKAGDGEKEYKGTEVLVLGVGEEVAMTGEGVWNVESGARALPPSRGLPDVERKLKGRARGRGLAPVDTTAKYGPRP